jgi:hypothetical protein
MRATAVPVMGADGKYLMASGVVNKKSRIGAF